MKRAFGLCLFLTACGQRVSPHALGLLQASVGVAAGELATAAKLERLQAIAADLKSTDPTVQKLGDCECTLLQVRAKTLGREVSAELPFIVHQADLVDQLSGDLQGAVYCTPVTQFDATKLAKLLGGDAARVEALLQPAR